MNPRKLGVCRGRGPNVPSLSDTFVYVFCTNSDTAARALRDQTLCNFDQLEHEVGTA
jgi:hypothetical protein